MDPNEQQNQNTPPVMQGQTPMMGNPPTYNSIAPQPQKSSNKKLVVIIVAAVAVLSIFLVLALVFSGSSGDPAEESTPVQVQPGPRPATTADVEQANNAISQDLSTMNDEEDFSDSILSDDELGL